MAQKLSDAQIKMLTAMNHPGGMTIHGKEKANTKRATKLIDMGLATCDFGRYGFVTYHLTLEGLDTVEATQPAVVETPAGAVTETVEVPATTPAAKAEDIKLEAGDMYFLARVALHRGTTSANRINPVLMQQGLLTGSGTFTLTTFGRDAVISNLWSETERLRTEVTRLKTQLANR
jgi:hypothetical protein